MKIINKVAPLLFLVAVMLASCNSFTSTSEISATSVMETAMSTIKTAVIETQAAIPTATLLPTDTPLPTYSPLPPTQTPIPTSALSFSGTPTVIPWENGLTWSECVIPNRDYSNEGGDLIDPRSCIHPPVKNEHDEDMIGGQVRAPDGGIDLRKVIGEDFFETRHDNSKKLWTYELVKNGEVILEMSPGFFASDPNLNFWNIGGKLVWELGGTANTLVVDGANYNEKYELEGSFAPYEIRGKLIYIAKKYGTFHIVYDNQFMGPEFDRIQMAHCCSMARVYHGGGQYWFLGTREGTKYVVSIQ